MHHIQKIHRASGPIGPIEAVIIRNRAMFKVRHNENSEGILVVPNGCAARVMRSRLDRIGGHLPLLIDSD